MPVSDPPALNLELTGTSGHAWLLSRYLGAHASWKGFLPTDPVPWPNNTISNAISYPAPIASFTISSLLCTQQFVLTLTEQMRTTCELAIGQEAFWVIWEVEQGTEILSLIEFAE